MPYTLTKITTYSYDPGVAGVPATPGRPALPPHWAVTRQTVCSVVGGMAGYTIPPSGYFSDRSDQEGPSQLVFIPTYRCYETEVSTYQAGSPAIPPTQGVAARAPSTTATYNFGWNAGAHSLATLFNDGYAEFKLGVTNIGSVVGLNRDASSAIDYRAITHAFYGARGSYNIYESGIAMGVVGSYSASTVFRIRRDGTLIRYYVGGTLVYTSLVRLAGPQVLDVSLYSGGDFVTDPSVLTLAGTAITGESGSAGRVVSTMPALRGVGGTTGTVFRRSFGTMRPLIGKGGVRSRARGVMRALIAGGGNSYVSGGAGRMAPMRGTARATSFVPAYGVSANALRALQGAAVGTTGTLGHGNTVMRPLIGYGTNRATYGNSRGRMRALTGYGHAEEPGTAVLASFVGFRDTLETAVYVIVEMTSTGTVSDAYIVQLLSDAALSSTVTLTTPEIDDVLLNAIMYSYIGAQDYDARSVSGSQPIPTVPAPAPAPGPGEAPAYLGPQTWVINLDSAASTRYENFAFNSFAKIDGKYYGAKSDGLYLLEGETDATAPIAARIDLGRADFNTPMAKRLEAAYMAVGCFGTMYLRVTDNEGNAYTYAARRAETEVKQHRVDVGRGFVATMCRFEIINDEAGADFELSGAEFMAVELSRRIR